MRTSESGGSEVAGRGRGRRPRSRPGRRKDFSVRLAAGLLALTVIAGGLLWLGLDVGADPTETTGQ